MNAELFCSRFALFRNLSPPTVDSDGGMRSPKHSSNNRLHFIDTFFFKTIFNKEGFFSLQLSVI